jgi:hypothetical protein
MIAFAHSRVLRVVEFGIHPDRTDPPTEAIWRKGGTQGMIPAPKVESPFLTKEPS